MITISEQELYILVRHAVEMTISKCKGATGLHKQINLYVNGNQIAMDVLNEL